MSLPHEIIHHPGVEAEARALIHKLGQAAVDLAASEITAALNANDIDTALHMDQVRREIVALLSE